MKNIKVWFSLPNNTGYIIIQGVKHAIEFCLECIKRDGSAKIDKID